MEIQSKLHQKLLDKVFVFTAETTPPDASDKETLLKIKNTIFDILFQWYHHYINI